MPRPKPLGGTDDRLNLQSTCDDHHKAKTIADRAAIRAAENTFIPRIIK
jgi:hypothetical protein